MPVVGVDLCFCLCLCLCLCDKVKEKLADDFGESVVNENKARIKDLVMSNLPTA